VVALIIIVIDERFNLDFEIAGQEVMLQQNAFLQGLMPPLDLALGLRVIERTSNMIHALVTQPIGQFTRD